MSWIGSYSCSAPGLLEEQSTLLGHGLLLFYGAILQHVLWWKRAFLTLAIIQYHLVGDQRRGH